MSYPCEWKGCPQVYVAEASRNEHQKEPHGRCSCNRWFTRHGMSAHKSQTLRHGKDHPEFPRPGKVTYRRG